MKTARFGHPVQLWLLMNTTPFDIRIAKCLGTLAQKRKWMKEKRCCASAFVSTTHPWQNYENLVSSHPVKILDYHWWVLQLASINWSKLGHSTAPQVMHEKWSGSNCAITIIYSYPYLGESTAFLSFVSFAFALIQSMSMESGGVQKFEKANNLLTGHAAT